MKTRKVLSMMMAAAMALSLAIPAFATGTSVSTTAAGQEVGDQTMEIPSDFAASATNCKSS